MAGPSCCIFIALVFFFVSAAVFIYGAEVNAAIAGKPPPSRRPDRETLIEP